jgi:hypothetical protein
LDGQDHSAETSDNARGGKANQNWQVLPESMLLESRSLTLHHAAQQHAPSKAQTATQATDQGVELAFEGIQVQAAGRLGQG